MKAVSLILSVAVFVAPSSSADPAGKFAANWGDDTIDLISIEDGGAAEHLAQVKPSGGKSLLIGLSGVVNILTSSTDVTASNPGLKGYAEAKAGVEVDVTIRYSPSDLSFTPSEICSDECGMVAAPGTVTLPSGHQKLEVKLGLDCAFGVEGGLADGCIISGDMYASLALRTVTAHHFNFIAEGGNANGLDAILYDVVACYDLNVMTDNEEAETYVGVQKRMLTVQQVQIAQNTIIENF